MVIFWLHVSWLEITSYDYQTMGVLALQPFIIESASCMVSKNYIYIKKSTVSFFLSPKTFTGMA
jgi:hypothetical protein